MIRFFLALLLFVVPLYGQVTVNKAGSRTTVSDRIHFLDAISFLAPSDSGAVLDTLDGVWETMSFPDADTTWIFRDVYVPFYITNVDSIKIWGYSTSTGVGTFQFTYGVPTDGSDPSSTKPTESIGGYMHTIEVADRWDILTITSATILDEFDNLFSLYPAGVITLALKRIGGAGSDTLSDTFHILRIVIYYAEE